MPFQVIRTVLSRGEMRERTLEFPDEVLRIGRGASNELRLEDLTVSLNHAEIRRDEQGRYVLRDLSQIEATYVNRAPVQEAVLKHGDAVRIQHYLLKVSQTDPSGPLLLSVEEMPRPKVEPSLALMPKLLLSRGRWTQGRIAMLLTLLVLAGAMVSMMFGKREVFMPGAVSEKHSKFAAQCEVCHASVKPVWRFVDNATCQTCHRPDILSPAHFTQEVSLSPPPLCASCHLEHKGRKVLADVPDQKCVRCHGDLKAKGQRVPDLAAVHNFTKDHPEFAISRSGVKQGGVLRVRMNDRALLKDDGKLKLNHALHLQLEKDYLDTMGIKPLTCSECHRADDEGHYMQPISFQRDCIRCHAADLEVGPSFPGKSVSHGRQPEAVRQQLDEMFSLFYLQTHPEEAKKPEHLRWIPGRRLPGQAPTEHERFVTDRRVEAERSLFSAKKILKCLKCHSVETGRPGATNTASTGLPTENSQGPKNASIPSISSSKTAELHAFPATSSTYSSLDKNSSSAVPSAGQFQIMRVNVPVRWLPYSRFKHQAHAALPEIKDRGKGNWCVACHENAPGSRRTEDVLLPSVGICRNCHMEPTGAQARCKSCHEFHAPKPPVPLASVPFQNRLLAASR